MTKDTKTRQQTNPAAPDAPALDPALCATVVWEAFFGFGTGYHSHSGRLLPRFWEDLLNPHSALARLFQGICYWKGFGERFLGWEDAYANVAAATKLDDSLPHVRAMARTHLAYFYLHGVGVDADPTKAMRILVQVVRDSGDDARVDARFLLAHCYVNHSTKEKNWEEAREILADLAAKGYYDALSELMRCVDRCFPGPEGRALLEETKRQYSANASFSTVAQASQSGFGFPSTNDITPAPTIQRWYPLDAPHRHSPDAISTSLGELSTTVHDLLDWGGPGLREELVALRDEAFHSSRQSSTSAGTLKRENRETQHPLKTLEELRAPAVEPRPAAPEPSPVQFLNREKSFFRMLLSMRATLSGDEFRKELQQHLEDETIVGKSYGPEVNHAWVELLRGFLGAAGLRVECLDDSCRRPALPRYHTNSGSGAEKGQFRTEHPADGGRHRAGGTTIIPQFEVIFAIPPEP